MAPGDAVHGDECHRIAAGGGHFPQRVAGEESDPRTVGRKERIVCALGSGQQDDRITIEGSHCEDRRVAAKGDVGQAVTRGRERDGSLTFRSRSRAG